MNTTTVNPSVPSSLPTMAEVLKAKQTAKEAEIAKAGGNPVIAQLRVELAETMAEAFKVIGRGVDVVNKRANPATIHRPSKTVSIFADLNEEAKAEEAEKMLGDSIEKTGKELAELDQLSEVIAGFDMESIKELIKGSNSSEVVDRLFTISEMALKSLRLFNDDLKEKIFSSIIKGTKDIPADNDFLDALKKSKKLGGLFGIVEKVLNALKDLRSYAAEGKHDDCIDVVVGLVESIRKEHKRELVKALETEVQAAKVKKAAEAKETPKEESKQSDEVVAAMPQNGHIPDVPDKPSFVGQGAIVPDPDKETVVPSFIRAGQDSARKPAPVDFHNAPTDQKADPALVNLFMKCDFMEPIYECAKKNGVWLESHPMYDQAGNLKFVCLKTFVNGVLAPMKSFTVELGQVIDRQKVIWPNVNPVGEFLYLEDCTENYRVFVDGKFNEELFDTIFVGGFPSINKAQSKKWTAYSSKKLETNKVIALITLPQLNGDLRSKFIDAINRIASFLAGRHPGARFVVKGFNKDDLSFTLTNEGQAVAFMGEPQHGPILAYECKPTLGEDGKPVIADNRLTFSLTMTEEGQRIQ